MATTPQDFHWSVTQAAAETGRDPSWIRQYIRRGMIQAIDVTGGEHPRLYLISISSMRAFDAAMGRRKQRLHAATPA